MSITGYIIEYKGISEKSMLYTGPVGAVTEVGRQRNMVQFFNDG